MFDVNWSLSLLFAPAVIALLLGVFVFLWKDRLNRSGNTDNSFWFLILLLIAAILSMISFVAFIFLHDIVG